MSEENPEVVGEIKIIISENSVEILTEQFDILDQVFWLETAKAMLLKGVIEGQTA